VAAITSAFPVLYDYRIPLGVLFIGGIATMNLRGLRESSNLGGPHLPLRGELRGDARLRVRPLGRRMGAPAPPPTRDLAVTHELTLFLVLRAFSSGCAPR